MASRPWFSPLTKSFQTRRANKYNAEKIKDGSRTFDSKFEYELFNMLKLMERAGEIKNIRHHPAPIRITPSVSWKADFIVFDVKLNKDVIVEAKGFEGERWRVIRQLLNDLSQFDVRVYKKKGNRIFLHEEIKKADTTWISTHFTS